MDGSNDRSRGLLAVCLVHALHDGYLDALYAFLPVWQAEFSLGFASLAIVRALYSATMGAFQIPAERLLSGISARAALILSTSIATAGIAATAIAPRLEGLCVGLIVAGLGSSIQHPRASKLVTDSYGDASRGALGIYNFSGDLGKAALPALVALLLPLFAWRMVAGMLCASGVAVVLTLARLMPRDAAARTRPASSASPPARRGSRSRFAVLTAVGALDTATRMGYLLFLPFLVHDRGGGSPTVGLALALLFAGGAFGKATCGLLAGRLGLVGTVMLTELATAMLVAATLLAPLTLLLALLPLLGIVLNGTSSVLYGTVPELARGDTGRAFAIFYTSVIGAGAVAPVLYGAVADQGGRTIGIVASAATALAIVPLMALLRPAFVGSQPGRSASA